MKASRPRVDASKGTEVHSILVRGVNWLGDAVMTTPALCRIRERFPDASVTMLCPEKLGELWWQHPAVDEVLMTGPEESAFAVARQLRARKFDLGVILPNSFRSAWELWLGRVPKRIGYSGNGRSWLLTQACPRRPEEVRMHKRSPQEIRSALETTGSQSASTRPPSLPPAAHHLHQYLNLARALGASAEPLAPSLRVSEKETEQFRQKFLAPLGIRSDLQPRLIGLNPGAEYGPAKRWPAERFAEVAIETSKRGPCAFVVFGGGRDQGLAQQITDQISGSLRSTQHPGWVVSVAGQTTLRELMAGLSTCDAVLTNDTGPMHVAAALGTPVVVPFGSTSAALTGPGLPGDPRHRLLYSATPPACSPCFLRECPIDFRCMTQLSTSEVAAAVAEVTSAARLRPSSPSSP